MPKEPFIVEICAGSARVTSCLQSLGLSASFGVDHKRQKNAGKILVADLTSEEGQQLCWSWIRSPSCMGVFCAPPCGTCSRARGIPVTLPNGVKIAGPQPLRSENQPDGVDHMSYLNRRRVWSANTLYKFISDICLFCIEHGMIVVVENPRSSLYWRTTLFAPLRKKLHYTAHQACAYGSDRPKWTVLAHNTKSLFSLCKICPGISKTHTHKPWGMVRSHDQPDKQKFSTSEETAYPPLLAYTIAFCIAQELLRLGWNPPAIEYTEPEAMSYQYLRSVVGSQPKASKLPPLLSEYSHVLCLSVPEHKLPVLPGQQLKQSMHHVPSGARLLRRPPLRLNGGRNDNGNPGVNNPCGRPEHNHPSNRLGNLNDVESNPVDPQLPQNQQVAYFGVYRTGEQFVRAAVEAGHPVGKSARLPGPLHEAVQCVANLSIGELAKRRHAALVYWLERGRSLCGEEVALKSCLPVSLQQILAPKRLLLWKEMLHHYGYPDCEVFDEVIAGVELAGPVSVVAAFDPCFKPAKLSVSELALTAKASRVALLRTVRSSGDAEIDSTVFDKTLEELECGWLEGPFEPDSLPDSAVVSRRFGIKQSSGDSLKVRLIDDFSASCVNDTVQVETASKLHTLDVVAALCMELLKIGDDHRWMGKTIDLSAAYRQLGVSPGTKWVSYIAVYDPNSGSAKIFAMRALPFGASKSVYGFLRVAHSLWWLGCKALHLTWSNFFDDFITLAREPECPLVSLAALQFFKLLGWSVALGDKDLPFDVRFKALGIKICCERWLSGVVSFANTEKRTRELLDTISRILSAGRLRKQDALVLRGRMQFAKAQMWGRAAKLCLSAVTNHAYCSSEERLSDRTVEALEVFRTCLVNSKPREVTARWDAPFFIFTDASFSPDDNAWPGGLGGVLVDCSGSYLSAFSLKLKPKHLAALGFPGKSTVIFEAEMLALLVALALWKKHIRNRPVVGYIDNNSMRDVCISGSARTSPGKELISLILQLEDELSLVAWYARVPSASNIADGPSRGVLDEVPAKFLPSLLVDVTVSHCLSKLTHDVSGDDP